MNTPPLGPTGTPALNNAHWNGPGGVPPAAAHGPAGEMPKDTVKEGTGVPKTKVDLEHDDVDIEQVDLWKAGNQAAQGLTFRSWGDPHEVTGDGLKFDNYQRGTFTKLQSASGDFMLQTRQDPWVRNPNVTVNTAAAIKSGKDVISYDVKGNTLMINGVEKPMTPGAVYKLPDGGEVRVSAPTAEHAAQNITGTIDITTAKGDFVQIEQKQARQIADAQGNLVTVKENELYIDIRGELSPSRKNGEVRGSLGAIDADTDASNDMVGRDGKVHKVDPKNQAAVDKFLEEWRTHPAESLFEINKDMHTFKSAFDTDGDGSYAVQYDGVGNFGNNYDLNKDGRITEQEYVAASARLRAMGDQDSVDASALAEHQRVYDRDKDGKVSSQEYFKATLGWDFSQLMKRKEEEPEPEQQVAKQPQARQPQAQ